MGNERQGLVVVQPAQGFLPTRLRRVPFKVNNPLVLIGAAAIPAIVGLGAGLFFFRRPVYLNTTAEASPFTNVTIDTTNTNNPQISSSQTATQSVQNSNNVITNTGNTVTVNNNGRRKRSLKEMLDLYLDKSTVDEKFMERFLKKHEDLLDDVLMVPDGG